MLEAMTALSQGNDGKDRPDPAPILQLESAFSLPEEETAERGLDHILGFDLAATFQVGSRQSDQAVKEPVEDL